MASSSSALAASPAALTAATRRAFVGGNWKCNPATLAASKALVETLNSASPFPGTVEVVVAPPALHAAAVLSGLKRADVALAVQNAWKEPKAGAWTGELTVDMVKDFGIKWVILGHSERRSVVAAESSELVGQKVATVLAAGLGVIACVGEKLDDRKAGSTMDVVVEQLAPIVANIKTPEEWSRVVIAYEPVWAIGTGVVATPLQAQETHANIRAWIKGKVNESVAASVRIIYGGSVTGANCADLTKNADIDGFLVGGASLKPEFINIVQTAATNSKM